MDERQEIIKCKKDIVYFIENYCLINNKPIKLTNCQKQFIINKIKSR